jgi:hypothetical protein
VIFLHRLRLGLIQLNDLRGGHGFSIVLEIIYSLIRTSLRHGSKQLHFVALRNTRLV